MAINFANVNVSIQQFQAVASGEFNAGEVKLTSETTLGKVNNFVTRKWKNKTDHTHEEVLAVKSAFIRALNSCGVVGDELARVRAKLGLAPEQGNGVDRMLGERSIKPLTRQEVREILDRYAGTINTNAGQGTIRTADELNAGVSEKERTSRTRSRNEVNASLDASRRVASNNDVMLFDRMVAGDFEGLHKKNVPRLLEMVQNQLASLREKFGDNPPADDRPQVSLQLPGGQRVEVLARGSSAELLAQLEDAEFFLVKSPFPKPDGTIPQQMSPDNWNEYVTNGLAYNDTDPGHGPVKPLPHAVRQIAKEILDEVRGKFGEDIIPQGAPIGRFIGNEICEDMKRLRLEVDDAQRVDLGGLRTALRGLLLRKAAAMTIARRLASTAATLGIQVDTAKYGESFLKRNPAIALAIESARTPAEVASAIDGCGEAFEKMVRIGAKIETIRGNIQERAAAVIADKTGVPASTVVRNTFLRCFAEYFDRFAANVAAGKVPCESADEAEAALNAEIARFAEARVAAFAKIDDLHLDKRAADALKAYVFVVNSIKPKTFDLDKFRAIADEVKPAIDTLAQSLRTPNLAKWDGINAINTFVTALKTAIDKRFENLETDESVTAIHYIFHIALNGDDAPAKTVLAFMDTLDADEVSDYMMVNVRNNFRMIVPGTEAANRMITATLGSPRMPPLHAAALVRAGRDAGLTAIGEEELLALFAPNKLAGKEIIEAINALPVAVSPEQLQSLAKGVLSPFENAIQNGVPPAALSAVVEG